MKRLLHILSVCIFCSITAGAADGQYIFKNFYSSDGLPNENITAFAQDKFGFIWVGTKEGIARFDGDSFSLPGTLSETVLQNTTINSLCVDESNTLWVATSEGIVSYDLNTGEFQDNTAGDITNSSFLLADEQGNVWSISRSQLSRYSSESGVWASYTPDEYFSPFRGCISPDGSVWFTANDGQIYGYQQNVDSFRNIKVLTPEQVSSGLRLYCITPIDEHIFLVSLSDNSVLSVNINSGNVKELFDGHEDGKDAIVLDILAHDADEYWIATDNGLYIHNRNTGGNTRYAHNYSDSFSLAGTNLRKLFKDDQNRIWIGTYFNGLSYFVSSTTEFYRNTPEDPEHSLKGLTVRSMCTDNAGNIWAATEDGFLNRISPDGTITAVGRGQGFPPSINFHCVAMIGRELYVCSYGDGLYVFDPVRMKILRHYDVGGNNCVKVLQSSDGDIFVGTSDALYVMDAAKGRFEMVPAVEPGFIHAMHLDSQGSIWVGYFRKGLVKYNPSDKRVSAILPSEGSYDISRARVTDITETNDGTIWLTTEGDGLCYFIPSADADGRYDIHHFGTEDGIPSNITCAIVQDHNGLIWVSTLKGIISLDKDLDIYSTTEYQAIGNYYRYGSVLYPDSGRIYMGAAEGIVAFNPDNIPVRKHNIYISDIQINKEDESTSVAEEGHSTITTQRIRIHSSETSVLSIKIAALNSDISETVSFNYKLTGHRTQSNATTGENTITYANLTPGRYSFTASVVGDDEPNASTGLEITVIPPFYASNLAKILYFLCALALIAAIVYFILLWTKRENDRKNEQFEAEKLKEIYESKIDFFTNVSHEIRTPLTLIKIPVDKIVEKKNYRPENEKDMEVIKSNTDRLLALTDQILDLRKIESGQEMLNFIPTDITELLKKTCDELQNMASECSVDLSADIPDGNISIMCAPGSVEKILMNLIVNGIKYCDTKVEVSMCISDAKDQIEIKVKSDGEPIESYERDKIFEPFYQSKKTSSNISVSKGTGLGLPLARTLAELHGGSLTLDNTYLDGNLFILRIPVRQENNISIQNSGILEDPEEPSEAERSGKYSILVVEDDAELNNYIKNELSDEYVIYQAQNGKQAIEILRASSISLIISDIMMPEMDGCQLCDTVKNTLEFSHIPVILLTAVVGYETQLKTLHSGADGYITKPFSMQLLRATIFNLFKNREILYNQFATKPFNRLEHQASSGQDDDFMNRLYDIVMEHISETDLSVFGLADEMHTSRSTLFRKVKANTGQNVNEYIRICRLKKAAELLSSHKYRINEVSYMVGFSSPSYFSKAFQKQFDISPHSLLDKVSQMNQ